MAALTGLRSLRHLDLNLLRAHQVTACHAKPSARHLLDCGTAVVVRTRREYAFLALPAFPAV